LWNKISSMDTEESNFNHNGGHDPSD